MKSLQNGGLGYSFAISTFRGRHRRRHPIPTNFGSGDFMQLWYEGFNLRELRVLLR